MWILGGRGQNAIDGNVCSTSKFMLTCLPTGCDRVWSCREVSDWVMKGEVLSNGINAPRKQALGNISVLFLRELTVRRASWRSPPQTLNLFGPGSSTSQDFRVSHSTSGMLLLLHTQTITVIISQRTLFYAFWHLRVNKRDGESTWCPSSISFQAMEATLVLSPI